MTATAGLRAIMINSFFCKWRRARSTRTSLPRPTCECLSVAAKAFLAPTQIWIILRRFFARQAERTIEHRRQDHPPHYTAAMPSDIAADSIARLHHSTIAVSLAGRLVDKSPAKSRHESRWVPLPQASSDTPARPAASKPERSPRIRHFRTVGNEEVGTPAQLAMRMGRYVRESPGIQTAAPAQRRPASGQLAIARICVKREESRDPTTFRKTRPRFPSRHDSGKPVSRFLRSGSSRRPG